MIGVSQFVLMGVAILFTTEFGVLDAATRISTDLVKITWLRDNSRWSEPRLYFLFLWGEILLGSGILLLETVNVKIDAKTLFVTTSAMNGVVMFLYSMILIYRNRVGLPPAAADSTVAAGDPGGQMAFFGAFSCWAAWDLFGRVTAFIGRGG
jgi:hypothetical protein